MKFCPLFSGSSGNSIFIGTNDTKILIDVGLPGKKIDLALEEINESGKNINAIFITHEHSDHIKGVGVVSRKYDIPIYANQETWNAMIDKLGKIKESNIRIIGSEEVAIGDMMIENFKTSHDAANSVGYRIKKGHKNACIVTDLGYFSDNIKEKITNSDVVLIECNHDVEMLKFGPYPYVLKRRILGDEGHVSNELCGKAIAETMTQRKRVIFLGHLSKTNNYPDLAYKTVCNILEENNVKIGKDLELLMANRDGVSQIIKI